MAVKAWVVLVSVLAVHVLLLQGVCGATGSNEWENTPSYGSIDDLALCLNGQEDTLSSRYIPAQVNDDGVQEGLFRCYVPVTRYPVRSCVCLRADCSGTPGERQNCLQCTSHSAYDSMEGCMTADDEDDVRRRDAPVLEYPEPKFSDAVGDTSVYYSPNGVVGKVQELRDQFAQGQENNGPVYAVADIKVPAGLEKERGCPHLQDDMLSWCDRDMWGGGYRSDQGRIVIPIGRKVLLEPCSTLGQTARFSQIVVPETSELVFANKDMELFVSSILVRGKLSIGSDTCRIGAQIMIVMEPSEKIDELEYGIISDKGEVDIHGRDYGVTWTRLAETALKGDSVIVLQTSAVEDSWQPGQQILITTSQFKDEIFNENEIVEIDRVVGNRITLKSPLQFSHYGGDEYQSEVALMSRNIILMGTKGTEDNGIGPQIFLGGGGGRIRGLLTYRAGQRNVKGAYPFHFHMLGASPESYFIDNVVYRSYYRCFVVHGTRQTVVERNVAFDASGHCFYLEDGAEEENVFMSNLAAFVHPIGPPASGFSQDGMTFEERPGVSQPADAGAAGFYISNPNNIVIGNAASGGVSGFSFPVLSKAVGMSRNADISPATRPFALVTGNTAHSSGYFSLQTGSCMYFGGSLREESLSNYEFKLIYNSGRASFPTRSLDGSTQETAEMRNNKVWLCNSGVLFWGDRMNVLEWTSYDTIRSLTLFSKSIVDGAFVSAESKNAEAANFPGNREDFEPQAGFQMYDTGTQTILNRMTFANFKYLPNLGYYRPSVIYSMTHSDQYKPEGMAALQSFTYQNVDYDAIVRLDKKETGSSRMFNFIAVDGSAVEETSNQIVGGWPAWWDVSPGCFFQEVWNTWVCPQQPQQAIARIDARVPGYTKKREEALPPSPTNYIGYISQFGSEEKRMTVTINEGITGVTGTTGWYLSLDKGSPKSLELWVTQLPIKTYIIFATQYPPGTQFSIQRIFKWYSNLNEEVNQVSSLDEVLQDGNVLSYFFDGTYLYLKLVDPQQNNLNLVLDNVTVYGTRWWDLHYDIDTNLSTDFASLPSRAGPPEAISAGTLPTSRSEDIVPSDPRISDNCRDYYPFPGRSNIEEFCYNVLINGNCNDAYITSGGYCALTCGKCSLQDT
ncbi:hypothetical protein M9434_002909 [Picochlorum sp. BPE23]|nr:hypothetical protein M9434_002909 [Picochlorum sp. BPE23]